MKIIAPHTTRLLTGDAVTPPEPANENLPLLPDWMTPAEAMQWVRQEKIRLSRKVDDDPQLWSCPEHRRDWDVTLAIEQMALRRYYGVQQGG
jgi:hypothetical protein